MASNNSEDVRPSPTANGDSNGHHDSDETIWMNAESCGFGPAALAYSLYPQIRQLVSAKSGRRPRLEFVGAKLALDFCTALPWAAVHHIDCYTDPGRQELEALFAERRPGLVFTVNDARVAEILVPLGARVVVLDSVLWYWKTVPQGMRIASLLLAQNWLGVPERIAAEGLTNARVVPALQTVRRWPELDDPSYQKRGVVVSLGGLQTPFQPFETPVKYARLMLRAIESAVRKSSTSPAPKIEAFGSREIAAALSAEFPFLRTGTPDETRRAMRASAAAFLTSGMGNIFDAVNYTSRACFLPAIAGSHGRQIALIRGAGAEPAAFDWQDCTPGKAPLDFTGNLANNFNLARAAVDEASDSSIAQQNLAARCCEFLDAGPEEGSSSRLQVLAKLLGRDDGSQVAKAISEADLGFVVSKSHHE